MAVAVAVGVGSAMGSAARRSRKALARLAPLVDGYALHRLSAEQRSAYRVREPVTEPQKWPWKSMLLATKTKRTPQRVSESTCESINADEAILVEPTPCAGTKDFGQDETVRNRERGEQTRMSTDPSASQPWPEL